MKQIQTGDSLEANGSNRLVYSQEPRKLTLNKVEGQRQHLKLFSDSTSTHVISLSLTHTHAPIYTYAHVHTKREINNSMLSQRKKTKTKTYPSYLPQVILIRGAGTQLFNMM